MADFKKIFEDLASGRPAKKPVSGNLLKQRAKENEKALKSGFMKMPDYVKKKFNEEEVKPHKMYKGDKVVVAKNKAEHDKLNKQGYTHDDPKTKKIEEVSDHLKTRYIHKSMRDIDTKERASQLADKQGAPASVGKSLSKSTGKRRKGIARARANLERPIKEEKKNCGCGQDPCITYGKKQMKEEDSSYYGKPSPRLKKKVKGGKEVVNNPYSKDDGKTVVAKQKKYQPQLSKSKQGVNNVLNFLKKNPDYKIGPHSLKKESTRDNYNPVVAKLRNKEKMKKVGLPAESPLVKEARKPVVDLDKAGIRDRLKTVKIKYNKPIKTKVTDIGPGGKETVRKDWSEGIERDPESNSFNRTKRKETTVRVGQKKDKKTGKMVDVMGKSSAPQGLPSMKEQQIQLVTNLDFNEGLTNLVSRGLDKVRSSIKDAEKRTGLSVDASKNNKNNPVSGDNIRKRLESQKKRKK